jgi:YVTN family beta-propeller protein
MAMKTLCRTASVVTIAGLIFVVAPLHAQTATTTVAAGTLPLAAAVNPVTNKIYVPNFNSNNVTVIDGATNATTTVAAGTQPISVAVNPVTTKN